MAGRLEYRFDHGLGIIRVVGSGLWTVPQTEAHFARLADTIRELRTDGKPVRVLVDNTQAPAQSAEVAKCIKAHTHSIYRSGDRIAMVVSSTIVKMQMRRVVQNSLMELFVSPKAAEIWLRAYDEHAAAA